MIIPLAVLVLAAQADAARVALLDRSMIRGTLRGLARDQLRLLDAEGREREIPLENLARITFVDEPAIAATAGERIRLHQGALLTGSAVEFRPGSGWTLETAVGKLSIRAEHAHAVTLAPPDLPLPDIAEASGDLILYKRAADDRALTALRGRLRKFDMDGAELAVEGETRTIPRRDCRIIYLDTLPGPPPSVTGWFARILLRNGDRFVGLLQDAVGRRIRVFSPHLGAVTVPAEQLHSLTFVAHPRLAVGHLLVCEQGAIRELDRTGREVWRFDEGLAYPWAARRLENGHVLVANTNHSQVLEIKPAERAGGQVVWKLDNTHNPYDVQRLENGNTLVAEYYSNRVSEYERQSNRVVWQTNRNPYPISAQRLPGGTTLICSTQQVLEVNERQEQIWKAEVPDLRPWRAERLESGNTLIVEQQRGQVVEVDPAGRIVWKKDGLQRPIAAARLEDGNTLILEQGRNHILDVDPGGREVRRIGGLNYPLFVTGF